MFDPKEIDYVILSHAHIDHCGDLPLLVKQGFTGTIFATAATKDITNIMLQDAAHIQEQDALFIDKHKKPEEKSTEPLYTKEDANQVMLRFQAVDIGEPHQISNEIQFTFFEPGHVLGAAQVYLEITEAGKPPIKLGFTGDLGRHHLPILRDPINLPIGIDFLITESTYGNRDHDPIEQARDRLAEIVNKVSQRGGKIIVPAFALERTQELIYMLHELYDQQRIPPLPIFVDSPLATSVTEIFRHHPECFDEETDDKFLNFFDDPFKFERVIYTRDLNESKSINDKHGPMIIISASGMCEFGRILHHLKNNIEDPRNLVLVVGFMAENTLGRRIKDGEKQVKIFGEQYKMKAEVVAIDYFSAHAGQTDLVSYITAIQPKKQIFIVHGEEDASTTLKKKLEEAGIQADISIPMMGDEVEI